MPCHSYSTEFLIRELSESQIVIPQSQQLQSRLGGKIPTVGIDGTCFLLVLLFSLMQEKTCLEERALV